MSDPVLRARVLYQVGAERERQDRKYGTLNDTLGPDGWLAVISREFCEAGYEANEMYKARVTDPARLREELIQLAAVAVAWVEHIDVETEAVTPERRTRAVERAEAMRQTYAPPNQSRECTACGGDEPCDCMDPL